MDHFPLMYLFSLDFVLRSLSLVIEPFCWSKTNSMTITHFFSLSETEPTRNNLTSTRKKKTRFSFQGHTINGRKIACHITLLKSRFRYLFYNNKRKCFLSLVIQTRLIFIWY
jgi:hypothetical protein